MASGGSGIRWFQRELADGDGELTGSLVVETIFQLPGIGRYFVQGALNRDYTLVMGVTVFYGVLIILANLAVDLIYGLLDPRIRYD